MSNELLSSLLIFDKNLKVFVILKTYPSFFNYFSTTSFAFALKVSFSGTRRIFLFIESVQISPCGFVCEREES